MNELQWADETGSPRGAMTARWFREMSTVPDADSDHGLRVSGPHFGNADFSPWSIALTLATRQKKRAFAVESSAAIIISDIDA
jgi:hypothetical protein